MGAGSVVGGTGKLGRRGGIIPAQGNPCDVTVTSATSVTMKAGQIVVAAANGQGSHSVTLTTDTVIDTITSDPTNPRIDVLVAEVICDDATGAGTSCQIKRVAGTAAASPARPSTTTGLPTNGQWQEIAQIRVNANGAGLVVTKLAGTDGIMTVAPGGLVPVASAAEAAAELAPFQPYVTPDNLLGLMVGAGAYQYGLMTRIMLGNVAPDSNGDFDAGVGTLVGGVVTGSTPFPNTCVGAALTYSIQTVNSPIWFTLISVSASNTRWRAYTFSGGAVVPLSAAILAGLGLGFLTINGIAWGY
jgi:hypothetical protein